MRGLISWRMRCAAVSGRVPYIVPSLLTNFFFVPVSFMVSYGLISDLVSLLSFLYLTIPFSLATPYLATRQPDTMFADKVDIIPYLII